MQKKQISNTQIAKALERMAELEEINGVPYKPRAYRKAAQAILEFQEPIALLYAREGTKGIESIKGIGKSIATKLEEQITSGKITSLKELEEKTIIRELVTHFFKTKGIPFSKLKLQAKNHRVVYARYAAPAKQLLELAGSLGRAKKAIDIIAAWANSRSLDYTIETVFKRWLELDRLKPKEKKKKAFYMGDPMVWSEQRKKWFVVTQEGDWLEFADTKDKIEWREE